MPNTVKTWEELSKAYDEVESMSCTPIGIETVKPGHIFDENQTVKWNRDKVEETNTRYLQEVKRLRHIKNTRRESVLEDIYRYIQDTVGCGLSRNKAMALWNYAWDAGHAFGINDIGSALQNVMDLAKTLLSDDKD